MVRTYIRKLGARRYKDYSSDVVEQALAKVTEEGWSLRRASREYKIPFGTLNNKYHGRHHRINGGQTVFSKSEEKAFLFAASICAEWGFPLDTTDLRYFAKNYLDSQGRNVAVFRNNLPGNDWVYSMLQRYSNDIVKKVAANIKRSRASVTRQTIQDYFNNLRLTLDNIPPSNVFNYDETNIQDDPGKKKLLFKRGTKYPERVCNFTKSATTIMMCGSASGVLLPPYIIYKSEKMWLQWTENGPKGNPCCNQRCCASGARYNRTSHGWMDAQTFTEWFTSTFLPHAKQLEGRKILLGDNLSSHFTDEVLRLCEQNNIAFVCLPKNSTHLTQPLDVGFFRPFKMSWRSVLLRWKQSHLSSTTVDKKDFPYLLSTALTEMDKKTEDGNGAIRLDLEASFRATGIVPFDPDRVLQKIPENDNVDQDAVHDVLVKYLEQQRFPAAPSRKSIKRQRLDIQPGKSVTAPNESSSSDDEPEPVLQDNSDDEVPEEMHEETEYFSANKENIRKGTYLLVTVLGGSRKKTTYRYVSVVQGITDHGIEVLGMKAMNTTRNTFQVVVNDQFIVEEEDVIAVLPNPQLEERDGEIIYKFKKDIDVKEL
ncbi:unnamed protein product [Acanthoscelides obtectus]|uniref:DDE-1 domain-containing protein n=1 Tax=Acanthoscelides obtectus TaxID=200917 RepID=A0A9P0JSS1_ACAOB|nr:unnamed protein product [Acanthoscelides obtectus]CAH1966847.1 unnamed protein product [Acanthoscelides obtectus]CAK1641113.1 Jerky protein homolog-like [Acanthoscelides obtectus]CAK1658205.1 Jerky protein homolog-like [Acanthoscelides obtectus]